MTPKPLPDGPRAVTRGWLNAVLGRSVGEVSLIQIGAAQGFTGGRLYRAALSAGGSVVLKFAPEDAAQRLRFSAANAREVAIYRDQGASLPGPACYFADADAATGDSLLVLEDLASADAVPFVKGLPKARAVSALLALAQVHAAHWARDDLAAQVAPGDFARCWQEYPARLADILPDLHLSPALRRMGDALTSGETPPDRPATLCHGDAQADNIRFSDGRALLFDWQFAGRGCGAGDVAYLLAGSLDPATRRRHERALLNSYLTALHAGGVRGYDRDDLIADYQRGAMAKLRMSVLATVLMDNTGPAKRAWRQADLARLEAFVDDHAMAGV